MFVLIHQGWEDASSVCACADEEENHQKEGLEVEKRRHFASISGEDGG